jgi:hypothetical protein
MALHLLDLQCLQAELVRCALHHAQEHCLLVRHAAQ